MFRVSKVQGKGVTKMGKMAVIAREGILEGRVVEIIPEGYLQRNWAWVQDQKSKVQFPIKKEDLVIL